MARSRVTIECTCGSTNFDMPKEPKPNDMIRCTQCGEEGIFDDVLMVRQIRSLLYEQGYTIGGARLRLDGEGAKQESALSNQIVRQVRTELEEVLQLLRR